MFLGLYILGGIIVVLFIGAIILRRKLKDQEADRWSGKDHGVNVDK
ncbi:MAG: hypothetical protein PHQ86_01035 [Dehalococcoidales bacterium]|nr:hypothetical protein [Dehalococcoidales bacterium]